MKILSDLKQGSPQWLAARVRYRCASEAPIVMGASRHMSRAQLVRMKATGGEKEFSQYVRDLVLARGKEVESAGILYAESVFDEALFPVTGVDDSGVYLASFDGLSMDEKRAAEVKLWNVDLVARVADGDIPDEHCWQMEHQSLVAGIDSVLFVVTDGSPVGSRSMLFRSNPERRARLITGWDLFEQDVASYKHVEILPPPAPSATEGLPALSIRVDGALALTSNLDAFGEQLRAYIAKIPAKPSTDQEFADCEAAIKVLERAESALKAAEDSALAQTASVEQMRRTVGSYHDLSRTTRLMLGKLVDARKESMRAEIVQAGRDAFAAHVAALNKRLGKPFMPVVLTDFPGAVKGLRTVQTLRDAISGELARAKLIANEVADQIQANMATLSEIIGDRAHLYTDFAQLVLKPHGDMVALARQRLAEADEKERKRLEAERDRIRIEEEAKARATIEAQNAAKGQPPVVNPQSGLSGSAPPLVGRSTVAAGPVVGGAATAPTGELRVISTQCIVDGLILRMNRTPTDVEIGEIEARLERITA